QPRAPWVKLELLVQGVRSLPSMMAPGRCRSPRLRPYGFEFVGMGHFWLVDFVDCIERCYIQTFPFLLPSLHASAPFRSSAIGHYDRLHSTPFRSRSRLEMLPRR